MKKLLVMLVVVTAVGVVGGVLDGFIIGNALSSLPDWKRIAHIVLHDFYGVIIGGTMAILYKPWTW